MRCEEKRRGEGQRPEKGVGPQKESEELTKPKSPGLRPLPSNISFMATTEMNSAMAMATSTCTPAPDATAALWPSTDPTPKTGWNRSPTMKPRKASMAMRACLISASCSHRMSSESEKPMGSNSFEPVRPTVAGGTLKKGTLFDLAAIIDVRATAERPAGAKATTVAERTEINTARNMGKRVGCEVNVAKKIWTFNLPLFGTSY